MAKNVESVSKSMYARSVGVDEKIVRRAIESGVISKGFDKKTNKIIVGIADKEWGDTKREEVRIRKIKTGEISDIEKPKVKSIPKNNDRVGSIRKKVALPPDDYLPNILDDEEEDTGFPDLDGLSATELLGLISLDSTMSLAEAVRRREIISLALDKLKLQEAERVMVKREEVNAKLARVGNELKMQLQAIPARVVREIMAFENEVDGIAELTKEINDVLMNASKLVIE